MTRHGSFDHELRIDSTTERFKLVRDENGKAMYAIEHFIPQYRNPYTFEQTNWIGGHGQYDFKERDMYFEGQSIDTTQDGRIILGPEITEVKESDDTDLDSAPECFGWDSVNSQLLCATSGKIYRYDVGSNGKWTAATTAVASIGHDKALVVFGSYIFASTGTTTDYYYSSDGDTWTASTLTDDKAEQFFVAPNLAGTADILWKFKQPNELTNNTSGINGGAQWSSIAYIGDSAHNITNIFLLNNNLMIGREDGLFHYSSDGATEALRTDMRTKTSTDNFKYVTEWQAGIYHSEIEGGMGELVGQNTYQFMGPITKVSDNPIGDIAKRGTIVGLDADKDFIYAAVDEGTNTIIYKGGEFRDGGRLKWRWCPFVFLGTKTCKTIKVVQHSTTLRRLWFGYTNSTAFVILSERPTEDSSYRFTTSGWVRLSYDYGTDANWDKIAYAVITETTGCNATGETVTIKYRKDTDTSATACTNAITSNGINKTNFTSTLTFKRIQYEINLASNTNTATPEVSYFKAMGIEKPERARFHNAVYQISDDPRNKAKTLRNLLRTARTSTSLVRFANLWFNETTGGTAGTDYVNCIMEPEYPIEEEIIHRSGSSSKVEMGLRIKLREVSFS